MDNDKTVSTEVQAVYDELAAEVALRRARENARAAKRVSVLKGKIADLEAARIMANEKREYSVVRLCDEKLGKLQSELSSFTGKNEKFARGKVSKESPFDIMND